MHLVVLRPACRCEPLEHKTVATSYGSHSPSRSECERRHGEQVHIAGAWLLLAYDLGQAATMECAMAEIIDLNEWWLLKKAAAAVRAAPRPDYCKVIDAGSVER